MTSDLTAHDIFSLHCTYYTFVYDLCMYNWSLCSFVQATDFSETPSHLQLLNWRLTLIQRSRSESWWVDLCFHHEDVSQRGSSSVLPNGPWNHQLSKARVGFVWIPVLQLSDRKSSLDLRRKSIKKCLDLSWKTTRLAWHQNVGGYKYAKNCVDTSSLIYFFVLNVFSGNRCPVNKCLLSFRFRQLNPTQRNLSFSVADVLDGEEGPGEWSGTSSGTGTSHKPHWA